MSDTEFVTKTFEFPRNIPLVGGKPVTLREPTPDEATRLIASSYGEPQDRERRKEKAAQDSIYGWAGEQPLGLARKTDVWKDEFTGKARALLLQWVDRCTIPTVFQTRTFLASAKFIERREDGSIVWQLEFPETLPRCGGKAVFLREPTAREVSAVLRATDPQAVVEVNYATAKSLLVGFDDQPVLSPTAADEVWRGKLCSLAGPLIVRWMSGYLEAEDKEVEAFFRGAGEDGEEDPDTGPAA